MKKIKFLCNKEINRIKWDDCIQSSVNSKIYAFSWYLDIVADDWDCLVYGNYELVFPIVIKKNIFFNKITHPLFCQQLGPFSPSLLLLKSSKIYADIISFLDKNYKNFQFAINHDCAQMFKSEIESKHANIKYVDRVNLELNLSKDYQVIFNNYSNHTKRHLKKNQDFNFSIRLMNDLNTFIKIFQKYVGDKANLTSSHYSVIRDLISISLDKGFGCMSALYNHNKEVLAISFFLTYQNRDILLFNASTKLIASNAMTVLVDDYIQKACSKNKVLDFEGSNIPGIKRFYKGFGAVERNYINLQK